MKGPAEKNFEGIYANPRFMHAAGIIVGCVVHVQVKSGSFYEGVLKTFSSKADFVLEMAHKIDNKKIANHGATPNTTLITVTNPEEIIEKLVFRFADVITMTATNVDPDYATRADLDTFTDTGISKFNGQVLERELEPWDEGALSTDGLPDLGGAEEEANGWDPNDMFRTNEEKYGVKSSFDSNLPGYTIPLTKQNTEEYKQQEAKASKIAQEIESGFHHKSRLALENGEEEDRFSAVVRPDNANNFRFVTHRPRKPPNLRNVRSPAPPGHRQVFHRVSSPASKPRPQPPTPPPPPVEENHKLNGESEKSELKFTPKPPRNPPPAQVVKASRKEGEKKAREDKTESLKRFHSNFKLPEEEAKAEEKPPDTPKSSNLNPNAKEFVFNPNAKSFTPRGPPMSLAARQSPIMALPQPHLLPQTVFAPHYVVSATPVSMPMAPPFTPAAAQAPRFRKAMPVTIDRGQPVHVQAATGQPILAQPAPQFAIQYPGMLHPPPQQIYTSMYQFMPRVLTPQPVGMVPTSAAYGETPIYMNTAPSTPPAPSPQPPTPTGTPQPVVYHGQGHPCSYVLLPQQHSFASSHHQTPVPMAMIPTSGHYVPHTQV